MLGWSRSRYASAMWLCCNVSTVMRMGWGQGRNLGCQSHRTQAPDTSLGAEPGVGQARTLLIATCEAVAEFDARNRLAEYARRCCCWCERYCGTA